MISVVHLCECEVARRHSLTEEGRGRQIANDVQTAAAHVWARDPRPSAAVISTHETATRPTQKTEWTTSRVTSKKKKEKKERKWSGGRSNHTVLHHPPLRSCLAAVTAAIRVQSALRLDGCDEGGKGMMMHTGEREEGKREGRETCKGGRGVTWRDQRRIGAGGIDRGRFRWREEKRSKAIRDARVYILMAASASTAS